MPNDKDSLFLFSSFISKFLFLGLFFPFFSFSNLSFSPDIPRCLLIFNHTNSSPSESDENTEWSDTT